MKKSQVLTIAAMFLIVMGAATLVGVIGTIADMSRVVTGQTIREISAWSLVAVFVGLWLLDLED